MRQHTENSDSNSADPFVPPYPAPDGHRWFSLITPALDSYGTRLHPEGAHFRRSGEGAEAIMVRPWLDSHDGESCRKVIGEMVDHVQDARVLLVLVRFDLGKPEAAEIYRQHMEGFLKGCSVGFDPYLRNGKPVLHKENEDGRMVLHYDEFWVMEGSSCGVPSNPEAIIRSAQQRMADALESDVRAALAGAPLVVQPAATAREDAPAVVQGESGAAATVAATIATTIVADVVAALVDPAPTRTASPAEAAAIASAMPPTAAAVVAAIDTRADITSDKLLLAHPTVKSMSLAELQTALREEGVRGDATAVVADRLVREWSAEAGQKNSGGGDGDGVADGNNSSDGSTNVRRGGGNGTLQFATQQEFVDAHGERTLGALVRNAAVWIEYGAGTQAAARYLRANLVALNAVMDLVPPGPLFRGIALKENTDAALAQLDVGAEFVYQPRRDAEGWTTSKEMAESFATHERWAKGRPLALVLRANGVQGHVAMAPPARTAPWFEKLLQEALTDKGGGDRQAENEYLLFTDALRARVVVRRIVAENRMVDTHRPDGPAIDSASAVVVDPISTVNPVSAHHPAPQSGERASTLVSQLTAAIAMPSPTPLPSTTEGAKMKPELRGAHRYMIGDSLRAAHDHMELAARTSDNPELQAFHREQCRAAMARAVRMARAINDSLEDGEKAAEAPERSFKPVVAGEEAMATEWASTQRAALPYAGRTYQDVAEGMGAKTPDDLAVEVRAQGTIVRTYKTEQRKAADAARAGVVSDRDKLITDLCNSAAGLDPATECEMRGLDPADPKRVATKSLPWDLEQIRRYTMKVEGETSPIVRTAPLRSVDPAAATPTDPTRTAQPAPIPARPADPAAGGQNGGGMDPALSDYLARGAKAMGNSEEVTRAAAAVHGA